jgi:hypothetical protein
VIKELRHLAESLDAYLARLELIAGRMTETADLVRGLVVNDVLFSGSVVLDAFGRFTMTFQAPYAQVAALNPSAAILTVTNAPMADSAPSQGSGVTHIPASSFSRRNIAGREVTLYGTAGTVVDLEVLTKPDTRST